MTASLTRGRALRYAGGSARGLLHHHWGHCPLFVATRPAPPALMVNPQAGPQSSVTSSKRDATNGFLRPRFARSRHHVGVAPRIRVSR